MQEKHLVHQAFCTFLASDLAHHIFEQKPYFDSVHLLQDDLILSQEIIKFCQEQYFFSFSNLPDIREKLKLTEKDYILDLSDVYAVYQTVVQWDKIKKLEIIEEYYPLFYSYIHEIMYPQQLLPYWAHTFDKDGKLLDSASPELKRIRSLKQNLRKQIEKIFSTKIHHNEDLAENRIAFREDRYVLPVKSVAKNRTEGIVHGFSSSGLITYIEPPEVIQLNNELLSVDDLEQQEIFRLLRLWSKTIAEHCSDLILLMERTADLEIYFGKYHFAQKYSAYLGKINTDKEIILKNVYNPFLLIKKGKNQVTPITIELESENYGIIISGPNAGGKSATLKTVALCVDLFLKGLPIPAEEASLPLFSEILLEIGDAQNLDDDLSTFSGHLYNIKNILKQCTPSSLVLIDEIAHATDPLEGEALACAIIDELIKKKVFFIITTHYKQVKIKSFEHLNIKTYATGFDLKELKPQYTLYPNTIGESYAFNIASKIGLAPHIVHQAKEILGKKRDKTEIILSNIEEYEKKLRQKEQELRLFNQKLEQEKRSVQSQKDQTQSLLQKLQSEGLEKADKELNYWLREMSALKKTLAQNPKKSTEILQKAQQTIKQKKIEVTNHSRPKKTTLEIGGTVFISSLNKNATIKQISKKSILVQTGNIHISVSESEIFEADKSYSEKKIKTNKYYNAEITSSVDVHGLTVEEALSHIDKHLYRASVAGLSEFTIIHGKGAGILQKAVQKHLRNIPEVKKFHFASPQDGGSGKTILYFE